MIHVFSPSAVNCAKNLALLPLQWTSQGIIDLLGMFSNSTDCYLSEGLTFSIKPKYDSDFSGIYMNRTQINSNCSKVKASKPCLRRSTIFAHFLSIIKFYLINFAFIDGSI